MGEQKSLYDQVNKLEEMKKNNGKRIEELEAQNDNKMNNLKKTNEDKLSELQARETTLR